MGANLTATDQHVGCDMSLNHWFCQLKLIKTVINAYVQRSDCFSEQMMSTSLHSDRSAKVRVSPEKFEDWNTTSVASLLETWTDGVIELDECRSPFHVAGLSTAMRKQWMRRHA